LVEFGVDQWLVLQYSGAGCLFLILKGQDTIPDYAKSVCPPLEPKLLVMWERIGEALQIVCEVLNTV
jgi:hypothetical protein